MPWQVLPVALVSQRSKHFFEALHLSFRLLKMVLEAPVARPSLLLSIVNVIEQVDEKVLQRFHFCQESRLLGLGLVAGATSPPADSFPNCDEPLTCGGGIRFPTCGEAGAS